MTNTAAPALAQLASFEAKLTAGSVIRMTAAGPDLEVVEKTHRETNIAFRLRILTGVFAGSVVTRYVHPFESLHHIR